MIRKLWLIAIGVALAAGVTVPIYSYADDANSVVGDYEENGLPLSGGSVSGNVCMNGYQLQFDDCTDYIYGAAHVLYFYISSTAEMSLNAAQLYMQGVYINMTSNHIYSSTQILELGGNMASTHALGTGAVGVSGALEVDGELFADSVISAYNQIRYPSRYSIYSVADDGMHIGLGLTDGFANGNLIIGSLANIGQDYDHQTPDGHPHVFIHSETDPDSNNTQYGDLYHNTTNFVIGTGAGAINFEPAVPYVIIGSDKALTDAAAVDFARMSVPQGGHAHATIWFSIFVAESGDTDLQSMQGMVTVSAVNEGGTVYCDIQEAFGVDSYAESDAASTLTVSFGCTEDAADTIDISANANTSFAATTTFNLEWSVQSAQDYGVSAL